MNARGWGCSYSGRRCGPGHESPSAVDIAVALGRVCRWAGNGAEFYPVLLHSMAVADMMPSEFRIYGLLHDATEAIMGDVPRPFKGEEYKAAESEFAAQILSSFRIPPPSTLAAQHLLVADDGMLSAEVWAGIGPAGLLGHFNQRSPAAEAIARNYFEGFPVQECVTPHGRAVREYIISLNQALREFHGKQN